MPNKNLLAQIHIAKKERGLTDPEYRGLLFSVTEKESSKDMTDLEAMKVIKRFKELGWNPKQSNSIKSNKKKFDDLGNRPGFATPKQLRKIHATWMTHDGVKEKNDKALNRYLKNIFGVENLRFIPSGQVGKVLRAIESLTIC